MGVDDTTGDRSAPRPAPSTCAPGAPTIQLRDRDIELGPGELFGVPSGVEHCQKADQEAHILLIEPKGNAEHERRRRRADRPRTVNLSAGVGS